MSTATQKNTPSQARHQPVKEVKPPRPYNLPVPRRVESKDEVITKDKKSIAVSIQVIYLPGHLDTLFDLTIFESVPFFPSCRIRKLLLQLTWTLQMKRFQVDSLERMLLFVVEQDIRD